MSKKGLSRRDFLRMTGAASAGAFLGSKPFGVPAFVRQVGDPDFSDPAKVGEALKAEGGTVGLKTWGFSGLWDPVLIPKFAEYTEKLYGVPVNIVLSTGDFGKWTTELPLAGKTLKDAEIDVLDKEEDGYAAVMALEWAEPIDQEQYLPLLGEVKDVEEPYLLRDDTMAANGGNLFGAIYQGYEWLQGLLRKDKVDVSKYVDWTDLAQAEMKGKGINYPFNDGRGHFVFMGILNSLIKQGIVTGDLWSEPAWEAGITWWKDNMEDKVLVYGDLGNDQTLRLKLQSGEAWWGGTWGVYTRELLGTDWNRKDDVLAPFYPVSGIAADRETLSAVKDAAHPVAARILINWFMSTEFQHAGWYKETPDAEAINHWNITESQYLVCYCGGVKPAHREAMPDWAKPYHPADPGKLILPINWEWYNPKTQWISETYDRIVKGI